MTIVNTELKKNKYHIFQRREKEKKQNSREMGYVD